MLEGLLSILGIYKAYEKWLWLQVRDGKKPEHVAIILDGNRRWAFHKSLIPWIGYRHGANKIDELLDWCIELDVKIITLYAFSTENFCRPPKEVEEIMRLIEEKLRSILENERIHENKIRVKAIGRLDLLPKSTQEVIQRVEEATEMYTDRFLNVALAYGGRAEIVDATKKIAKEAVKGELNPDKINEKLFEKYLYTAHMPKQDADLIIRTSGEERLSGFLSWQSAYSELCFVDVNWPEFRLIDLLRAVRTYQRRKRRFGK
ncbi:di-trans,poly-cis-decaprenylcistransferase [archaeon]|jgi:tritrans,polycis-undecaprenyl-diphosphate synthase [geranylgeranyl-diphosphate specific]|nr:di-trans,poly-cis-decaprenylcistransferase [archaeon]